MLPLKCFYSCFLILLNTFFIRDCMTLLRKQRDNRNFSHVGQAGISAA